MAARRFVRIDTLPESAWRYSRYDAIVCVDILLATTTIVSAVAQGRRVFPATTMREGFRLKSHMSDATVVTDALDQTRRATMAAGPSWLTKVQDRGWDLVHVSPLAGMMTAEPGATVYVACLRNLEATVEEIARRHRRVAVVAAGEDDNICTEDQMAAAWLAARLEARGFSLEGHDTRNEVVRWGRPDIALVGWSRSAERLRKAGRGDEVAFVLEHVDDLDLVCAYADGELRRAPRPLVEVPIAPAVGWGTPLAAEG